MYMFSYSTNKDISEGILESWLVWNSVIENVLCHASIYSNISILLLTSSLAITVLQERIPSKLQGL